MADIEILLGQLLAKAEEGERQRVKMFDMIGTHGVELAKMSACLKTTRDDVKAMKPHVENFKRLRNRGIGLLIGAAIAGGSSGAGITTWLNGLFK